MFEHFDWIGAMRSSPVMVIILACSVVTFGFAIERSLYFWKRRGNADDTYSKALAQVKTGNTQEAVWTCLATQHPMGPVAAQVIKHAGQSPDALEETLQIALSEQRLELERHLGLLGTMGNTAPLIGLLGTVWGIYSALIKIGATGQASIDAVAGPVGEALIMTAIGLFTAIPAVLGYNFFVRLNRVTYNKFDTFAHDLHDFFATGARVGELPGKH